MDKIYGVGVVGYGFMGQTHTYGYHSIPFFYDELPLEYTMKGVCVRREETIGAALKQGGFEFGTTRFEDLLERDDIDIIHICTPNDLHRDQVIKAIEVGKHVYCDKPLASTYAECEDMVKAIESAPTDLVTQVALQYRFYPSTMRARQLMEEKFLGNIYSFRACYLHASNVDPEKPLKWKMDKAHGGGVLYDLGSHVLDLVNHLIGPFDSVMAETHTATKQRSHASTGEMVDVEVDDMAIILLRTRCGALGSIEASKIATGTNDELRIEIHGEHGALRLNLMDPNWLEIYDMRDDAGPIGGHRGFKKIETVSRFPKPGGAFPAPALNIGWLRSHVACLHNFLAAIAGKADDKPSIADGAELQRIMDAAYSSAEVGAWQKL